MYVNETALHDEVIRLVEWIDHDPDPISRLEASALALASITERLLKVRDAAAYTARQSYSNDEIEARTGLHPETIREYVKRHRAATGAPPPPRRATHRLATALDASR